MLTVKLCLSTGMWHTSLRLLYTLQQFPTIYYIVLKWNPKSYRPLLNTFINIILLPLQIFEIFYLTPFKHVDASRRAVTVTQKVCRPQTHPPKRPTCNRISLTPPLCHLNTQWPPIFSLVELLNGQFKCLYFCHHVIHDYWCFCSSHNNNSFNKANADI